MISELLKAAPPFVPGLLPHDLGLKGFTEIRGIHLGSCPALDTYGTTAYYVEQVRENYRVVWQYPPRGWEGAHTHMHPKDPYYLHICFWDAGYAKTTVLIHEYCHVLWALQHLPQDGVGIDPDYFGRSSICHGKEWGALMASFGLAGDIAICPEDLDAKYYYD